MLTLVEYDTRSTRRLFTNCVARALICIQLGENQIQFQLSIPAISRSIPSFQQSHTWDDFPPTPLSILRGTESVLHWECPNKQTSMLNPQEIFTSDCYCFAGRYNAAPNHKDPIFLWKGSKNYWSFESIPGGYNDFVNVWEHLQSERGCKFWAALAC